MMTYMMQSIHNVGHRVDAAVSHFTRMHPYLSFVCRFVGMPLLILLAVCVLTSVIVLPVAWLCGWI